MLKFRVTIEGTSPLLMNKASIEVEGEAKPKKRVQPWLDGQAKRNWMESAYYENGMFVVPAPCLDAMMRQGAKRVRGLVERFKWGVSVEEAFVPLLVMQGGKWKPLEGEVESFYIKEYIDLRPAIVPPGPRGKKINRCRPRFNLWSCSFHVLVEDSADIDEERKVTEQEVRDSLTRNSLMGYRPYYGRFKVVEFKAA